MAIANKTICNIQIGSWWLKPAKLELELLVFGQYVLYDLPRFSKTRKVFGTWIYSQNSALLNIIGFGCQCASKLIIPPTVPDDFGCHNVSPPKHYKTPHAAPRCLPVSQTNWRGGLDVPSSKSQKGAWSKRDKVCATSSALAICLCRSGPPVPIRWGRRFGIRSFKRTSGTKL